MDLNEFAFQKLKEIRPNRRGVISFPNIRQRICPLFSLKKRLCHKLLMYFRKENRIEYVHCRGIRITKKGYKKSPHVKTWL
jgi:hypothetical protein